MSEHMSEWLSTYHDGELRGSRLHQVEVHLIECELCQAELESLDRLSIQLHEVPAPEFTSPQRFAAQVNLRLPHKPALISKKQVFEVGWWMIPVGLLSAWIFISIFFLFNDTLSTAHHLGLLSNISSWSGVGLSGNAYWSATLGQIGILSGRTLDLASSTETFTRSTLPEISLQISIALLYLSWIAIWWVRFTRHQHGQVLEG